MSELTVIVAVLAGEVKALASLLSALTVASCRAPAGRLSQGDHVEALLALALIPAAVDGHHREAVHGEGPELGHGGPGLRGPGLVFSPRLNRCIKYYWTKSIK